MFSRRDMLAATAAGGVMTAATMTTATAAPVKSDITFGNPNDPPQGAINAKNPRSVTDPGPPPRCCLGATPLVGERPRSNGQTTAWPSAPQKFLLWNLQTCSRPH
jgi:hypothetical protein